MTGLTWLATTDPMPSIPFDSSYPLAGILLFAFELLRRAALHYKEARQIDVEGERAKAAAAGAERDQVKRERQEDVSGLKAQIEALEDQVRLLRGEISTMRRDHHTATHEAEERHTAELRTEHRRLENEIRTNFRMRQHMAEHGLTVPEALTDTDHPAAPYPEEGL